MPEVVGRLRTPRLAAAPTSPATGEMYYDTATNKLYWWNGTTWIPASSSEGDLPVRIGQYEVNNQITNLNTVTVTGWGYAATAATGNPVGNYAHVFTLVYGGGIESRQWARNFYNDAEFTRRRDGAGTWSAWQQLTENTYDSLHAWNNLALQGTWASYGGIWGDARFRKAPDGLVTLQGLLSGGSASVIANLPPGYRPGQRLAFLTPISGNAPYGLSYVRLDLEANGNLSLLNAGVESNMSWVSLAGVTYYADQ